MFAAVALSANCFLADLQPATESGTMALFMQGVHYQMDGDLEKASIFLNSALQEDPLNSTIALTLADVYLESRQFDKSLEVIQKILTHDPENIYALLSAGRIYYIRQDLNVAVDYYGKAWKLQPNDPDIALPYSQILIRNGDNARFVDVLKNVDHPQAYWILAEHYLQQEDYESAERYLKSLTRITPLNSFSLQKLMIVLEARGKYLEAAEILSEYLNKEQSNNSTYHLQQLARLYRQGGSCHRAIPILKKLIEQASESTADLSIELGRCFVEVGEWDEAESLFTKINAVSPENILVQLYLIHLKFLSGKLEESLKLLKLVEQKDLSEEARTFLLSEKAEIYKMKGNMKAAEAIYYHLWEKEKNSVRAEVLLDLYERFGCYEEALNFLFSAFDTMGPDSYLSFASSIYLELGDRESAQIFLQALMDRQGDAGYFAAVRIARDAGEHHLALSILDRLEQFSSDSQAIQFTRATLFEELGRRDDAIELFRTILKQWPDHYPSMNYLGYMWAETGINLDEALNHLETVLQNVPENGAYLDSMGWILFQKGQYGKALPYFQRAFRTIPHDAVVIEHMADTLKKLGRLDEAMFYYRLALKCFPENPDQLISKVTSSR